MECRQSEAYRAGRHHPTTRREPLIELCSVARDTADERLHSNDSNDSRLLLLLHTQLLLQRCLHVVSAASYRFVPDYGIGLALCRPGLRFARSLSALTALLLLCHSRAGLIVVGCFIACVLLLPATAQRLLEDDSPAAPLRPSRRHQPELCCSAAEQLPTPLSSIPRPLFTTSRPRLRSLLP
jgi:hypothetical protein